MFSSSIGHQTLAYLLFAEEFAHLMEMIANSPGHIVIMGDVNIQMIDSADNDTITMNDIPDSFNVMNNILVLTHRPQNTLDVMLTDAAYSNGEGYTVLRLPSDDL